MHNNNLYVKSDPDAVYELSAAGRMIWEQFISACSAHAGRPVSGDEISAIMKRIAKETGQADPQFADPEVKRLFFKYLQEPAVQ
jgi:hypothetical protein